MSAQLLMVIALVSAMQSIAIAYSDPPIALRNCTDHCGNVSIPFPFGIDVGCFYNEWFEIKCKSSPNPKPDLSKLSNVEVREVIVDNDVYRSPSIIVGLPPVDTCVSKTRQQYNTSVDLRGSPFRFLGGYNVFTVEGCSGNAVLRDQQNEIIAGCGTVCKTNNTAIPNNSCYGVQCCQTLLSSFTKLPFYHIDAYLHDSSGTNRDCLRAALIQSDLGDQYAGLLSSLNGSYAVVPVVLSWGLEKRYQSDNGPHAYCHYDYQIDGQYCNCNTGFFGNPYLPRGCRVPENCKDCKNYCSGRWDYARNRPIPNLYYCFRKPPNMAVILGLSISVGIVLLVIAIYGLCRYVKRRRAIRRSAKFFKRNGGLLLHQQLSCNEGVADGTKIFTISELEKATDHFNENRILGQGGQGTVYKGMLVDGRIVAIKKAKLVDESQLEQFINEVVILSQINHRNVVKLLGCCLETEVPLLVYEFIPHGTLSQHIHDPHQEFSINWEKRLKIVLDSASAIAYLHSSSSTPVYHRDIKSSNILLDERHRAKVSDFGSSKTIAIDQTHLTTLVQGTMGYLDPEYFQSYQFTDKSDVYSFGVVLLELLTSKKPIYKDACSMEQKNLVTEFLFFMEQSALSNILDSEVVREAKEDELIAIVELATRCTKWSGKLRPTMKEVAMTLEMIIKSPAQVPTFFQQQEATGSAETVVPEESHAKFMSNPLPTRALNSPYMDRKPYLPDTI